MKKILLLSILSSFCLILSVNASNTSTLDACKCATFNLNEKLSIGDKVRSSLATGFWTKKSVKQTQQSFIQFHESGRVDWVLSSRKAGTSSEYHEWELDFSNQVSQLILKNTEFETEQQFTLERICEGILLTNQETKTAFVLKHECKNQAAIIKSTKTGLAGSWNNATYPYDISKNKYAAGTRKAMKSAFLKVTFLQDGTYLKKYGNNKINLMEKGEWEISQDGQFVFLHHKNKTSVAKIQHLDLDEMVLEWQLEHPQNTDFSTTQKSFAFIR